ncbi:MAG: 3-methyl-2-oxobutanoate dehydrogenase subunit beta [Candidatus Poseidoniia archaeon]|jgi:2-oxoglutarate ferredoxin oxidoreductase subunit alpha|nr:3-methyl-2-oxobutanoate dehydrogenase subunit beta [Candidatus Poseidoniia archaeon]MDP6846647.1 3-methyl-2-oxobutanoate dehydrogenase subunit beta [Candidatus Poseidoniia archaeon]MDP7006777.1 3-methyl-2-oxobutanoate dehydrogenase subunit beta [Candidatus Poseidoniia archaeon]|tara:strand:- start:1607 stop:2743 length:1137 start_codon:yes stop_codon:yes gene_type:complete
MTGLAFMKGNEAIAIGALRAGLNAYFGYPITPSTEVAETMAAEIHTGRWPDYKVYLQASSELEAINMVLGSASAGMRAMTFTASPGFSLKQEGISYGVGMMLPFVVGNVNRGGPGLGNLGAEQSDYWQVTRGGGHGGYRLPVYAPASVQEILSFPGVAFDTAFRYRTPVLLVFDAFTGQFKEDVQPDLDIISQLNKGCGTLNPEEDHWEFDLQATEWAVGHRDQRKDGARRVINSLFLDEDVFNRHSATLHDRWKRIEKCEALWEEVEVEDAEVLIVAYGITARISRAAVTRMRGEGLPVGLLRPATISPFPAKALADLAPGLTAAVTVELSHGQMFHDVQYALRASNPGVRMEAVNRTGGIMPTQNEIIARVKEVLA